MNRDLVADGFWWFCGVAIGEEKSCWEHTDAEVQQEQKRGGTWTRTFVRSASCCYSEQRSGPKDF